MALHTLGTNSTTILTALPAWSAVLAPGDVAAIAQAISGDGNFGGASGANPTAVLATGATHSNTTLDTLVSTGGAALASIHPTDIVLGAGIIPGTFVQAVSGTTVTLSQAALASASIRVAFVRLRPRVELDLGTQMLSVPGRGTLKVLPGDFIAIDNTGWPILLSGATVNYAGSQWTFT